MFKQFRRNPLNGAREAMDNAYLNVATHPVVSGAQNAVGDAYLNVATHPAISRAQNVVGQYGVPVAAGAAALGAGYLGNQALGNPIGQGLQSIGNMINGSDWDGQYGSPIDGTAYSQLSNAGNDLYAQQVADSMTAAERAGNFQHNLQRDAANQQYSQELGMQMNRLQAEREMQNNQLQAAQANQMLNGYVDMIQSANQRAAAVAGNRY